MMKLFREDNSDASQMEESEGITLKETQSFVFMNVRLEGFCKEGHGLCHTLSVSAHAHRVLQ